jgi:hypothetical protein
METHQTRRQLLKAIGLDLAISRAYCNYLILESGRWVFDGNAQYGAVPFGHRLRFVIGS